MSMPLYNTSLSDYRLPELTFSAYRELPDFLLPVWKAMYDLNPRRALELGRDIWHQGIVVDLEQKAALRVAIAAAELRLGNFEQARQIAEESLQNHSTQWAAHRIVVESLRVSRAFDAAYLYLSALAVSGELPGWDEPLTLEQHHTATASMAWQVQDWEGVALCLAKAFPNGLNAMPENLLEDLFRLAFYRDCAEDAAAAAVPLLTSRSISDSDTLIQTMVQQGWNEQALALYRSIYSETPNSPLLRRRIVGLCIRTGDIDEARRLSGPGALDIAA